MKTYQVQKNDFLISTDKTKLNIGVIHDYLSKESYWAKKYSISNREEEH